MGTAYCFTCTGCEYAATVSRGPDGGFAGSIVPMFCRDCQELVHVAADDEPVHELFEPFAHLRHAKGHCPQCDGANVAPWGYPWNCPRCGWPMKQEGVVWWD